MEELTNQDRQMGRRSRNWKPELDEDGQLCNMDVSGWIQMEFRSAEFGDERLTDRLRSDSLVRVIPDEWVDGNSVIPLDEAIEHILEYRVNYEPALEMIADECDRDIDASHEDPRLNS
jgi:hypothetical protein